MYTELQRCAHFSKHTCARILSADEFRGLSLALDLGQFYYCDMKNKAQVVMSSIKPGHIDYGKPVAGSKTEARGRKAHERISNEIVELVSHFMNFHSNYLVS